MDEYVAKGIFRNGHTNSILAGSLARKLVAHKASRRLRKQAQYKIIPAKNNIRLSALYNIQPNNNAHTVVLLHGWLGCADSLYLLTLGDFLYQHGYNVVRLNLRDHGGSQHLNKKLFHSCRIQEVINACISIQQEFNQALSLIGFSLGGNFALRINAYTTKQQLKLNKTIAFCPVIDPYNTLLALENSLLVYRNYFMQRWKSSYYKKADAFPETYSKKIFDTFKSLRDATENLAIRHAGFDSLESYLNGYSIAGNRLQTVRSSTQIILAKDDPIIPWQDESKLADNNFITKIISNHGGHCGFLEPDLSRSWINQFCHHHLSLTDSQGVV